MAGHTGGAFVKHVDGLVALSDTTAQDVIPAQPNNNRIVVTSILVVNAHATVGTKVEIRSGTTVRKRGFAAAGGGGWAPEDDAGGYMFIGAPGEAITARCVTTGADVDVNISGFVLGTP